MLDKSSSRETGRATRRSAAVPFLAGGIAAALTVGVVVASGGGAAGAAPLRAAASSSCTTTSSGSCIKGGEFCPKADYGQTGTDADGDRYKCAGDKSQPRWEPVSVMSSSVGRFLDGAVGGNPIQSVVDLQDARAKAPGTQSQQNPLDAKLFGQADIPIGNSLKLPGGGVFQTGAANQVAVAKASGYSYGASGAVSNSGGVSLGGNDNSYPADASINLSSDSLSSALGSTTIPGLPSLPSLPAGANPSAIPDLGAVSADVGAVSALASTKSGGTLEKPTYKIADLNLDISSPALAALLKQLAAGGSQLTTLLGNVTSNLPPTFTLPANCDFNPGTLPTSTLTLDSGAVTLDASSGEITVSVAKLLDQAGFDLNSLPPNTDLLALVLAELPNVLSNGLENTVNGIVDPIQSIGSKCLGSNGALATLESSLPSPLGGDLTTALTTLTGTTGQSAIESAVNSIATALGSSSSSGIGTLTDQLANVADIGVNVQQGAYPLSSESKPKYKFTSGLEETPDQATPIVNGQAVVRAIEIDLLNTSALSTDSLQAKPLTKGAHAAAAAAKTPAISLALGNAAVGSSSLTSAASPSNTAAAAPASAVPTGVPAGQAQHAGASTPSAVLALLALLALMIVGSGTFVYRRRRGGLLH